MYTTEIEAASGRLRKKSRTSSLEPPEPPPPAPRKRWPVVFCPFDAVVLQLASALLGSDLGTLLLRFVLGSQFTVCPVPLKDKALYFYLPMGDLWGEHDIYVKYQTCAAIHSWVDTCYISIHGTYQHFHLHHPYVKHAQTRWQWRCTNRDMRSCMFNKLIQL